MHVLVIIQWRKKSYYSFSFQRGTHKISKTLIIITHWHAFTRHPWKKQECRRAIEFICTEHTFVVAHTHRTLSYALLNIFSFSLRLTDLCLCLCLINVTLFLLNNMVDYPTRQQAKWKLMKYHRAHIYLHIGCGHRNILCRRRAIVFICHHHQSVAP